MKLDKFHYETPIRIANLPFERVNAMGVLDMLIVDEGHFLEGVV